MAGLIYKDMCYLRKNIKMFLGVTAGVIVVAVLFLLSAQYGNIAKGMATMEAEGTMSGAAMNSFFSIAIWVMLFIPMAFVCMVSECFSEDRKAGFAKQLYSLPMSDYAIVGSRYLSCMFFSVVSMGGSVIAAVLISVASKQFVFKELLGAIVVFGSVLLIYMSLVMAFIYLIGSEKTDLIMVIPFVLIGIVLVVYEVKITITVDEAAIDSVVTGIVHDFTKTAKEKWMFFLPVALGCMAASWFLSCKLFAMRKENI